MKTFPLTTFVLLYSFVLLSSCSYLNGENYYDSENAVFLSTESVQGRMIKEVTISKFEGTKSIDLFFFEAKMKVNSYHETVHIDNFELVSEDREVILTEIIKDDTSFEIE